jgi:tRNA nucleotidyltransferase (CCA-adding enzyme)
MKVKENSPIFSIPKEVANVAQTLETNGFEAYLVGGCVRDLLLKNKPRDWDITTNATPEDIIKLFPKTFYENSFGTVGVVNEETTDESLKIIEVTPYREEGAYSDNRRPDSVTFSKKLEDDLKRRDFTINAIAMAVSHVSNNDYKGQIIDLYKGQEDIEEKTVRTVGDAETRFKEDGLRLMRAVRIATELGFTINNETEKALKNDAPLLKNIAPERIREELSRILVYQKNR